MQTGHNLATLFMLAILLLTGCKNDTDTGSPSQDPDAGTDLTGDSSSTSDSESQSESTLDSSSEDDSETEHTPPDLPNTCHLDRGQTAASEKDDWSSDTKGDGRSPEIVHGSQTLMIWRYLSVAEDAAWEIQVAPFDPEPDGGLPGPDPGPPGPVVTPASPGPLSLYPKAAANDAVFGVTWQDGRWDLTCEADTFTKCGREIAFLTVDSVGLPLGGSVPLQITMGGNIATGPAIAGTNKGYIVVWAEKTQSAATVMAISIAKNGTLGTPKQISVEDGADHKRRAEVAAIGNVAVVVWGTNGQSEILARTLDENAEPQGDINVVYDAGGCLLPNIAAGSSSFLVSWGQSTPSDYEIFLRKLDKNGIPIDAERQATWSLSDNISSAMAWNGDTFAMAWQSTKNNGTEDCLVDSCNNQILAALFDENGDIQSAPVRLSNDPNPVGDFDVAWDGSGWTALYELPRFERRQIFYGRMVCD